MYSPVPKTTDNAKNMNSKNTAGTGMNEPGSKPSPSKQSESPITPAANISEGTQTPPTSEPRTTSKTGQAQAPHTKSTNKNTSRSFSTTTSTSSSMNNNNPFPASSTKPIKQAKNDAKATLEDTQEDIRHAAKKKANAASSTLDDTKEDLKHAVNTASNKTKQTGRKVKTAMGAPEDDYADSPGHTPGESTIAYNSATPSSSTTYTSNPSYSSPIYNTPTGGTSTNSNMNTQDMKQRASNTAESIKANLKPSPETKAKLNETLSSVKEGAARIVESLKAAPSKMGEMKDKTAERLSKFGDRMEEKFEKFGENLIKSGEEIERRDREAKEPTPAAEAATGQPIPGYDEVDHLPNPENLNDTLPGTGAKDREKHTPITQSQKDRGQFPG